MKLPFFSLPARPNRRLLKSWRRYICLFLTLWLLLPVAVACMHSDKSVQLAVPTRTMTVGIRASSPTPKTLPPTWTPVPIGSPIPSATRQIANSPTPSSISATGYWVVKQIPDLTLTPTRADSVPQAARDAYNAAFSACNNGEIDRALEQIEIALSIVPQHVDYIVLYGQLLIENNFPIRGETELNRALVIDPFHTGARLSLAELYARYGRWTEAEGEFTRYTNLTPANPDAWFALGQVREQQNRIDEAISAYSETLKLDPAHQKSLDRRSELYLLAGNASMALADISTLIEIEPSAHLFVKRAELHLQLQDPLAAVDDYNKAIALFSAEGLTCAFAIEMGNAFLNAQYPIQASSAFSMAVGLDPNPEAFIGLGESYLMMKDFPAAMQVFSQTLPIASTASIGRLYSGRGRAFIGMQDFGKAVSDLTQAIAHADEKTKGELLGWRSQAYEGLGQTEAAIADLTQAIQVDPTPILYYRRGLLHQALGLGSKASRDLKTFLATVDPDEVDQALIDNAAENLEAIKNN